MKKHIVLPQGCKTLFPSSKDTTSLKGVECPEYLLGDLLSEINDILNKILSQAERDINDILVQEALNPVSLFDKLWSSGRAGEAGDCQYNLSLTVKKKGKKGKK